MQYSHVHSDPDGRSYNRRLIGEAKQVYQDKRLVQVQSGMTFSISLNIVWNS